MQELTLVGVHEDGEHLILDGPDGQRFVVRVDESLRVAVRRDRARLGQLQIQADGRLRPREIQARIRAGQTAEEVAQAAGIPVEHVRRYEGPVLAEREFVARQARSVRVRRPGAGMVGNAASAPTLEEVVHQRLTAREVDDSASVWDAWRSEDGSWTVALTFTTANRQRQARWTYDVQLRHVTPLEDEARWLTEDEPAESGGSASTQRRLATVRAGRGRDRAETAHVPDGDQQDRVYDVEADGGVRMVEGDRSPAVASPAATVDLLDSLRERRGRRHRITLPDDDGGPPRTERAPERPPERQAERLPERVAADRHEAAGDERPARVAERRDEQLDAALQGLRARAEHQGTPPAAHPPRSRPELAVDAELLVLPDTQEALTAAGRGADRAAPPVKQPSVKQPAAAKQPPATDPASADEPDAEAGRVPPSRRARRASVPSWDDIVFGSRRE